MSYLDRYPERTELQLTRREIGMALGIAAVTALLLGAILGAQWTFFTPGTPAPNELVLGKASPLTLLASQRATFVSALETGKAREQAASQVADAYDTPDANIAREQVRRATRLVNFLDTVRADPYASLDDKVNWVRALPGIQISRDVVSRTLGLEDAAYRQVMSETLYVIDAAMREEIRERDLAAARQKISSRISLVLSAAQADLVNQWAQPFIVPNTKLNVERTERARQQAREQVGVVYRTLEQGQAIVRAGEVITPETLEALRELGYLQPQNDYQAILAAFLFAALVIALGAIYLVRVALPIVREPRVLMILAFLLLVTALGAKIVTTGQTIPAYLFPFAAAAMLGAALLSVNIGAGMAWMVALTVAFSTRGGVELTTFALIGGLVAVVSLRHRERLTSFLVTGAYVAFANVGLVFVFRLLGREQDWSDLVRLALAAFGSGALTGLIALSSQFLLGKAAGITTALELIDLSRPTHPLLQKILREAPGTYHHSLIISNLAEHAAQVIGADALLCRVGAYYHDVGKTLNPQFFVENQFDGVNPHNAIDPRTSTKILHEHVTEGAKLARKYGVSTRIVDLILQHHGTTLPLYFFEKAQAQAPGAALDETEFRYPGPKPQTREAAIMMLADGAEATTRAERPANAQEIRAIIDRIIEMRIREGQLDESAITLRDLEQIRIAFLQVLQGLYHPRVKYPTPRPPAPVIASENIATLLAEVSAEKVRERGSEGEKER
ncbi:MAG: HDIG domain-containing protein [Chloroflexi bacterium]|nr:HDIG domain-containing protein [Chloroflexota bacterium]